MSDVYYVITCKLRTSDIRLSFIGENGRHGRSIGSNPARSIKHVSNTNSSKGSSVGIGDIHIISGQCERSMLP